MARIRSQAPFLHFAPVVAISALTGLRAGRVLDEALQIAAERRRRVPTARLNRILSDAVSRHQPPPVKGRRPRFYYATQATIEPPTFVLFASDARSVHFSYQRFLENRIRDAFQFEGTPLRLVFRERSRVELEPRAKAPRASSRGRSGASGAAAKGRVVVVRQACGERRRHVRRGRIGAIEEGPHDEEVEPQGLLMAGRGPVARSSAQAPGAPRWPCSCRAGAGHAAGA